ncbi:MAG TPA: tetratricopeptide repeat protein [Burkholderiales bacterium]|nr:tetratricopeptide repeat protein [Burkholderiales bacterium]
MHSYGVREVEKLLRLPRSTIHALVRAGFVAPERGPRNALRFSFQDLIVLRTAQALAAAKVPAKRITQSLKQLRRQLPEAMPLSGLSIGAVGDRVVVKDGGGRWQADSGQYLLAFEGNPEQGSLKVIEKKAVPGEEDIDRAVTLHEEGKLEEAERVYRAVIAERGDDTLAHYNYGVLLEDMGRDADAAAAYEAALKSDPRFADCHYNLALVAERLGQGTKAIRHMAQYRRLVGKT